MLGSASSYVIALNTRPNLKIFLRSLSVRTSIQVILTKLHFSVASTAHTDSGTYKCLGSNTVNNIEQGFQAEITVAVGKDFFLGTI